MRVVAALALAALAGAGPTGADPAREVETAQVGQETAEIERAGVEMLEAWYGGDADKMARVLHDDLAKRGVLTDPATGATVLRFTTKAQTVEGARSGVGRIPRDEWDIHASLLDREPNLATVKVVSKYLVDVCQVARFGERWLVVNVLWTTRGTPPWLKR